MGLTFRRASLEDLDGDTLEVGGARGGGEVVDLVQLPANGHVGAHVVVYVLEVDLIF
jgi:glyoxylase-like metal-dependent hydrolase (beta-lactamase superfamily II)